MRILRIIISGAILSLFMIGLILPGESGNAILDKVSLVQFFPALQQYSATGRVLIPLIIILVITVLFGRVYCSSVCPLGTIQDIFIRRKRKFSFRETTKLVRWVVPIAALLLGAMGIRVLIILLEPFAMAGRLGHNLIEPVASEFWHLVIKVCSYFDIFLRPLPMALEGTALLLALLQLVALATLVFARGRFYCNSLCPVGAILSILAKFSFFGIKIDRDKCISCGKCNTACKAECLDLKNFRVDHARCVVCFSCTGKCPTNAISYGFLKSKSTALKPALESASLIPADPVTRRDFIVMTTAAVCAVPVLGATGKLVKPDKDKAIAPPGAGSIARFNAACTGCQLCVNACPERVLRPSFLQYGISGMQQPVMKYNVGYCAFECNKCGQVCPNGAIMPLTLEKKQLISIGLAEINEKTCVSFVENKACGACAEVCPVSAVYMADSPKGAGHVSVPRMRPESCLGCGACENACPVPAIIVKGRLTHTRITKQPRTVDSFRNISTTTDDFAF